MNNHAALVPCTDASGTGISGSRESYPWHSEPVPEWAGRRMLWSRCRDWIWRKGLWPAPRRVLLTIPRSGTHWLKQLISAVLGRKPLEVPLNQETPVRRLQATLRIGGEPGMRLVYGHFDYDRHSSALDPRTRRLRMLLLIRHPLDALISQYHKMAADGVLPHPEMDVRQNIRRCLRDRTRSHAECLRRQALDWMQLRRCGVVRYEDLVADTPAALAAALNHLAIPWSRRRITDAVAAHDFRSLSGGRRPGESDPSHHYRRGLPGEWRHALNDDDLRAARRHMGREIEELGYSLD